MRSMISIVWKVAGVVVLSILMLMVTVFIGLSYYAGWTMLSMLIPIGITALSSIYCFAKAYYCKLYKMQALDDSKDMPTRVSSLKYLINEGIMSDAEAKVIIAEMNNRAQQ